ncbi:hypothetical protein ACYSNM_10230 [Myroides sp. LJL116]
MKQVNWLIAIMGLFTITSVAQQRSSIDGRIRLFDGTTTLVEVFNKQTKEKINSDVTGYYMINAAVGDTLRFSSAKSTVSHYVVGPEDLTQGRVNVVLVKKGQSLEEIVIIKKDFGPNFFDLTPQQKLSQAELNYKVNNTLTTAMPNGNVGINIGALINLFNGKRKADKQAIAYEKMELMINNLVDVYPREELVQELNMPEEFLEGFLVYLVNQPDFAQIPITHDPGYLLYLAGHYEGFLDFIQQE